MNILTLTTIRRFVPRKYIARSHYMICFVTSSELPEIIYFFVLSDASARGEFIVQKERARHASAG